MQYNPSNLSLKDEKQMEEGNWEEDWDYEQGREKKERKAHTWWTSICCQNSVSSASSSNCSPAAIVCVKKKSANTSQAWLQTEEI